MDFVLATREKSAYKNEVKTTKATLIMQEETAWRDDLAKLAMKISKAKLFNMSQYWTSEPDNGNAFVTSDFVHLTTIIVITILLSNT